MIDLPRDACAVCGGRALKPFLHIESFPVFQGCVAFARGADEGAPMSWVACGDCGVAQIAPLPDPSRIYQAGHATGLGAAWTRHHKAFAKFLDGRITGAVADVGGGSGTLAIAYRGQGGDAPWTILEPNALRAPDLPADVAVMDAFLDAESLNRSAATNVVMCHMFEHAIDLRGTLEEVGRVLPQEGRIFLAWPDLQGWARKGVAGALNFEHGVYLTVPRLLTLFDGLGWQAAARHYWAEHDTWFLAFARGASGVVAAEPEDGAAAVSDYFARLRRQANKLAAILEKEDGEAFLMPASIYAQALLALGLKETRLTALLDNSPAKQGRRLYGTGLMVHAPQAALGHANAPIVILNGGAHDTEMAAGLSALRPDARIIKVADL